MPALDQTYRYHAGGETIVLEPDAGYIGVGLKKMNAAQRSLYRTSARTVIEKNGATFAVVPRGKMSQAALGRLKESGAAFPVFSASGGQVIALPEVRVEMPSGHSAASGWKGLGKWL